MTKQQKKQHQQFVGLLGVLVDALNDQIKRDQHTGNYPEASNLEHVLLDIDIVLHDLNNYYQYYGKKYDGIF